MKEYFELFYIFFKLGLFTFGGGYAMIPQLKEIIIEKKKWLTSDELIQLITLSESTPGPIAVNIATFIGYRKKKILGAIYTTFGVILPSLIIIYIISMTYQAFITNRFVQYAFIGIKCAVSVLIINAGIDMIKKQKSIYLYISFAITLIILITLFLFSKSVSSIYFILLGAAINMLVAYLSKKFEVKK